MPDEYSSLLAVAVKRARENLGWTQEQLAEYSCMDVHTIINIEKERGNPKLEKLFPLVRSLHMDAREIFDRNINSDNYSLQYLKTMLDDCTEEELILLLPIIQSILNALRSRRPVDITKKSRD